MVGTSTMAFRALALSAFRAEQVFVLTSPADRLGFSFSPITHSLITHVLKGSHFTG
jgi:hypothetical protein